MRLFRGTRCSAEVLMGLFRESDGAETAGATCAALVGPGNAGCEDQGEGEPRTKPHSSEAQ